MAANIRHLIEGERCRLAILEYMKGKAPTSKEMCIALSMSKEKLVNYIHSLQKTGHIVKCDIGAREFKYKRTNKPFYTMEQQAVTLDKVSDIEQDEPAPVVTSPNARVVRLLSRPLPPPPAPKRRSIYSGIQSGMGMFSMEAGL